MSEKMNLQQKINDNNSDISNLTYQLAQIKENNQSYQEEMTRTWKIADDYKSRIDKALEKLYCYGEVLNSDFQQEMIKILEVMIMSQKVLLNSGYKYMPNEHYKMCDRFYSKSLSENPTKTIRVLYYDKFKENGTLDYDYEFEYIEERKNYWYKTYIWGLNKEKPYTIEEIEKILIEGWK